MQKNLATNTFVISKIIAIFVVLTSLSCQLHAKQFNALDAVINEQLRLGNTAGVSLAIIQDEKVIYQKAFGKSKATNTSNDLQTSHLFRTASTLKMMVGTALAELHFRGRFDIHAPINKYVPNIHSSLKNITTHQLLTHTSGILDESSEDGNNAKDALFRFAHALNDKDIFLPPGTAFSYSNPAYSLAGYILEVVTGKSFYDAFSDIILSPLTMTHSTFDLAQARRWGTAYPHSGAGADLSPLQHVNTGLSSAPSGTLLSNTIDYANFIIALLNSGKFSGEQVFLPETVAAMSRSYIEDKNLVTSYGYSYGLMVGKYRDEHALFHSGGMPGYASNVMLIPKRKIGIVLLTNGRHLDRNKVIETALASLYPLAEKVDVLKTPSTEQLLSREMTKRISGSYKQRDDLPKIKIKYVDGKAVLTNRGVDYTLYQHDNGKLLGVSETGSKQLFKIGFNETNEPQYVQWWIRAFAKE